MLISLHSLFLEQRQKFLLAHSIAHYHRNLDYKLARRRNSIPIFYKSNVSDFAQY